MSTPATGFISNEEQYYITLTLPTIVLSILSVIGVGGNIINITIFIRQKVKDNVSVALLSLSFSDLGVTMISLAIGLCHAWEIVAPNTAIDPVSFRYAVFYAPWPMFSHISAGITILVSFERCLCVAAPLKIKDIITPVRMVLAIACIHILILAVYLPMYLTHGLAWTTQVVNNVTTTRLTMWVTKDRNIIQEIFNFIVIGHESLAQITVFCFSLVMIAGLKKSNQFRQSAGTRLVSASKELKTTNANISTKETRLVKVVLLVAVIFVSCNSVFVSLGFVHIFVSDYNVNEKYHNLYTTCNAILFLSTTVNSSVNCLVYYKTSSKYKDEFAKLPLCFFS